MERKSIVCNSPIFEEKLDKIEKSLPPLGLGYIASEIEKTRQSVELLDAYSLNLSSKEVVERIKLANPNFLVINIFSINKEVVFNILKQLPKEINIICGGGVRGIDFSNLNLENKLIVIDGEGEKIIPHLLNNIPQDRFSKFLVNKESEFYPQNLSELTLDHKFFLNDPQLNKFGKLETYSIYSRGCIYSCTFCGSSAKMKQTLRRTRDKNSLIQEVDTFSPKAKHVRFLDDLLIDNSNDIDNISSVMEKNDMTWSGMVSILSVKKATDLELQTMYNSGCTEIFLGIESGSEKTLKLFNKHSDIEDIITHITRLLKIGFDTKIFLILGAYKEELSDLQKTLNFANRLANLNFKGKVRFSPFMYKAYEGTELYNKIAIQQPSLFGATGLNSGIDKDTKNRGQFNSSNGNFSNCTTEEINQHINSIINLNYL